MSSTRVFLRLFAVALLLSTLGADVGGQAPNGATGTAGPPRRTDGKPDLSGVWMPPYVPDMTMNKRDQRGYAEAPFSPDDTPQVRQSLYAKGNKAELPFTTAGLADWARYDAATGDYTGSCFPFGLQRSVNAPYPFQIMQDDQQVALLFEIYALDSALDVQPTADAFETRANVFKAMQGHILGKAVYGGLFRRPQ